jgi:hypothetical protein
MLQEARCKLGNFIIDNELKHPMVLNPQVKNNFVESKVVLTIFVGAIFTNLEN